MPDSIEGKVSLDENYSTTDDESDNESDDNRETVDKRVEAKFKENSIFNNHVVKKTDSEKCSKCQEGYQDKKSIYYAKDTNEKESILMINKGFFGYNVKNLNLLAIPGAKAIQKFKSLKEIKEKYPILKVIPNIKKYYSAIDGTPIIPGKDEVSKDGLIVKEVPDYEGVGLTQPQLAGGKKTRTRKTKKNKKSRKSKNKKSRKTKK
jgi:hypothetical protein